MLHVIVDNGHVQGGETLVVDSFDVRSAVQQREAVQMLVERRRMQGRALLVAGAVHVSAGVY